jgi:uncharacterized protein
MRFSEIPFSLLVKPASADCNLDCTYCFYLDRNGPGASPARSMPPHVLERLIAGFLEVEQEQHVFAWQGGEPTLMGLRFFEEVVALQRRYARPGARVANCLQTNALLIDDEFAAFLAGHDFLLGVSLDGPADVHDRYRRRRDGSGTHAAVMKAVGRLARHGVLLNAVSLVSRAGVDRGREIYRYLRDQGFIHHQYLECVEFVADGRPQPYSITAEEWGRFLCEVFDEWIVADTHRVSVRLFDALLSRLAGGPCLVCSMGSACGAYAVVESNGDVFPCDFFVRPEWKAGNILESAWGELRDAGVIGRFAERKRRWGEACSSCRHLDLCQGDCPKNRRPPRPGAPPESWLCRGWLSFYEHALPGLRELAREIAGAAEARDGH